MTPAGAEPGPEQWARLEAVRRAAALVWRPDPVLLPGHANDVWQVEETVYGPGVLRVGWRGDRGRLVTEAKLGRALPAAVGYPRVLSFGWTRDESDLTWTLTRRLPGRTLADAWADLPERQRAEAVRATAVRVRHLHAWRPSAAVSDRLLARPATRGAGAVVDTTRLPLPLPRVEVLEPATVSRPGADPAVVRQAYGWLSHHRHLEPALDQPGLAVTSQDLHLGNVWWDGDTVAGLLDLEWARLASPWTDLHLLAERSAGDGPEAPAEGDRRLLDALVAGSPALDVPHLGERLAYCRVAAALRDLAAGAGPVDRPLRVLQQLTA